MRRAAFDRGERCDMEAGMAKYFASRGGARELASRRMRIHGAYGYSKEYDIERLYRDAPLTCIGEGTNEMQRIIIAKQLIKRNPVAMKPLEGLRIAALEQFGAAPYGTMLLADLGAEVIKIENATVGGDPRGMSGPIMLGDNDSQYFQTWNSTRRASRSTSSRTTARRLGGARRRPRMRSSTTCAATCRRSSASTTQRSRRSIRAVVCVHISAYGRDNERAAWPGYDYLMQAEAGLMSLTGEPDGPPARFGAVDHRLHDRH